MHENGYKWMAGNSLIEKNYWGCDRENTCYCIDEQVNCLTYSDIDSEKGAITYQQFKQLLNENNMKTKEVKIQVPEGYEIDKENSTFELIKFKPIKKVLSYEDVAKELFCNHSHYYEYEGDIYKCSSCLEYASKKDIRCTSAKQTEKLIAINKLMNVAKYLNGKEKEPKDGIFYCIRIERSVIVVDWINPEVMNYGAICFNSVEAAKQAIEILGEETIKLVLSTDW